MLDLHGILVFLDDHCFESLDFQVILDPRGILVCLEDRFV